MTISAPHRAKPRLSCEAKAKALCANMEATAASFTHQHCWTVLTACEARTKVLSTKDLCREGRDKVPLGTNSEAILAFLEGRALHS